MYNIIESTDKEGNIYIDEITSTIEINTFIKVWQILNNDWVYPKRKIQKIECKDNEWISEEEKEDLKILINEYLETIEEEFKKEEIKRVEKIEEKINDWFFWKDNIENIFYIFDKYLKSIESKFEKWYVEEEKAKMDNIKLKII